MRIAPQAHVQHILCVKAFEFDSIGVWNKITQKFLDESLSFCKVVKLLYQFNTISKNIRSKEEHV
jgi:hypothetical protein